MKCIAINCKSCGAMFYVAMADGPSLDRQTAQDIRKYLEQGHLIENVTSEEVRERFSTCVCDRQKAKQNMKHRLSSNLGTASPVETEALGTPGI